MIFTILNARLRNQAFQSHYNINIPSVCHLLFDEVCAIFVDSWWWKSHNSTVFNGPVGFLGRPYYGRIKQTLRL